MSIKQKINIFPNSSGVYIFYDKNKEIIYVGKATSLRDRVGSYFQNSEGYKRPIEIMIHEVADIEIKKTETVLEAYILEQELIKKFQPKYNVDGKDDKSFSYVLITKENFPRILIVRKTDLEKKNGIKIYGPYISKKQIEIALKILRKIFPYHNKKENSEKGCLDFQMGLCPGPYVGAISKSDYQKNIRGIRMILEGKKKNLMVRLKKEMAKYSKKEEFEKAGDVKSKIFALQHIQDVALISSRDDVVPRIYGNADKIRIEGFDISNISGKFNVGSMVVFDNSAGKLQANKNEYRKFRIKIIDGANDVGAMREILIRRFQNSWPKPDLILLDGGAGHLNMARKILRNYKLEIPLMAVAKGPNRKKLDIRTFGNVPEISQNLIEQIRNEAHRFAILYHRKLRGKEFGE